MVTVGPESGYERQAGDHIIRCTRKDLQPEITEFVAQTYYYKAGFDFDISYDELLGQMFEEDRLLQDYATVYTVYNSKRIILGTVRTVLLQDNLILPIQREFKIDLQKVILDKHPVSDIIEVSRFATNVKSVRIVKLLLMEGIANRWKDDLLLAAIDRQVLQGLNRLGFSWEEIGKPRHYRGSLTYPVAQSIREIKGIFGLDAILKILPVSQIPLS